LTESTGLLTSAQAAARLGVKAATLYAYVSRGLLVSYPSADGRRSFFDPADIARLERRGGERLGAPSDVIVASELSLIDATKGRISYRGVDALDACTDRTFEEIVSLLWVGSFDRTNPWRSDPHTLRLATKARSVLARAMPEADRIPLIGTAIASVHEERPDGVGAAAASDVMATLVDVLPGGGSRDQHYARRLWHKLTPRPLSAAWASALNATMSLLCERGLTHPALVARLTAARGGSIAASAAAALSADHTPTRSFVAIERALAIAASDGTLRATDTLDADAIELATSRDPFRSGDPRTPVLMDLIARAAPNELTVATALSDELNRKGAGRTTASYAACVLSWAAGMPPGSAALIIRIARTAGWIAHALEEHRRPTPYRPRLAYTGPPPRPSTPRRPLDAVRDYLARE
jgi:citrate synthase